MVNYSHRKVVIYMQREITVKEFEEAVSSIDDIEPMIVKRENKKDLIVISLEQYEEEIFLGKLEKSKKQYKEGKVHSARTVFKGLREKYGY
jgi:PHD/YefM family antitoxin component YafN of YafNO toxin-antitoxin module